MQRQLINHSLDLVKLIKDGYQVEVSEGGGHLLVHHIPYLNSKMELKYGTLVDRLNLPTPQLVGPPHDHTIYITAEKPHNADGSAILTNNDSAKVIENYIHVQHYYSRKPPTGNYPNYYEKIKTYTEIFESQAKAIHPQANSKPNKKNETNEK